MDTLTVYETILYSALLRLPKRMSYAEKVNRVQETMLELDIFQIANRRIGNSGIYHDVSFFRKQKACSYTELDANQK